MHGILVFRGGGQGTFGTFFNTLDESAEAVSTYEMSDPRVEPRGVGSWLYLCKKILLFLLKASCRTGFDTFTSPFCQVSSTMPYSIELNCKGLRTPAVTLTVLYYSWRNRLDKA